MKKLLLTLGITQLCTTLNARTPHFFYNYGGEKVFLSLNTNYAFLSVREQSLPMSMRQRSIEAGTFRSDGIEYVLFPNNEQVRNEILQANESGQNRFLTKQQTAPRFYTRPAWTRLCLVHTVKTSFSPAWTRLCLVHTIKAGFT